MTILLIDGVKDIVLHNGVLRVDCVSAGPNGQQQPSGTLLIPANIAAAVVQTLANALTELDRKMREQMAAQPATATPS
jgi:hypothetical protein